MNDTDRQLKPPKVEPLCYIPILTLQGAPPTDTSASIEKLQKIAFLFVNGSHRKAINTIYGVHLDLLVQN